MKKTFFKLSILLKAMYQENFNFRILSFFDLTKISFTAALFICSLDVKSDSLDVSNPGKKKILYVSIGAATIYTSALIGLDRAWYKNSPQTSFHFFNDNKEWNQMDKFGHFYSSFYISTIGIDLLKWGGLPEKKAIIIDNILGLALLTPIEILDGYSSAYGASWGDEIADAAGDVFVLGQYLLWKEIRLYPKFSYHPTNYAALRPNVLGSTMAERLIKDYNGQTYWLSIPIKTWCFKNTKFPGWLSVSFGYSAKGMVYADPTTNRQFGYTSYRQYFISPDINFRKLKVKNKVVRTVFYLIDLIHLPLPALEYNSKNHFVLHGLYF
jgi:hypothetical protein